MALIRTAMASAFINCVAVARTQPLDRVGRMVVRKVLTNEASGLGTKHVERPRKPGKTLGLKKTAVSAGNVGVAA